ncbi:MAG: hypothetical protein ACRCVQ_07545 [Acinetobacter ursingii]
MGSWRHTPFRKFLITTRLLFGRSWRHTPFRKSGNRLTCLGDRSWRHTPFRNNCSDFEFCD